ncbi:hypothetical protein HGH93_31435 [Chitinophaga polysaccharea]|uniref:DNA cytosine methyltransferase n=1 Tax=Chitinophaga TaxID=79328 RepID=UPI0014554D76|nr:MULTISPECIES: DNA cytosine methyltransferase [Chitinophaga]NLR62645.1 hypothetical protein [Chitinophaga polysaccharea]NLU91453.1 hypothetical protein [Chitinophaga sp. Ak27]
MRKEIVLHGSLFSGIGGFDLAAEWCGWPCQKYSVAGSRIGSEPLKEVLLDVVEAVRPGWAVLENVFGFIT